jgi:formate hydrogenlyase transcriptional activator
LANRGTLLLDEIGDIPLELQPKLLRVLQESEFERLGSSRTIKTDVRLIAATNANLPELVEDKKFRSDLYYRLNVFPIRIPPLRERREDIPLLASYFTKKHARRMSKPIESIPRDSMATLSSYDFPGNVRELENFIERAVILTRGVELEMPLSELRHFQRAVTDDGVAVSSLTLEDVERNHIAEVLKQTGGTIGGRGGAAEILNLPVSTLRHRMKKLGLM